MFDKIEIPCPRCGHRLAIPKKYAGRMGACKYCSERFLVPDESTSAVTNDSAEVDRFEQYLSGFDNAGDQPAPPPITKNSFRTAQAHDMLRWRRGYLICLGVIAAAIILVAFLQEFPPPLAVPVLIAWILMNVCFGLAISGVYQSPAKTTLAIIVFLLASSVGMFLWIGFLLVFLYFDLAIRREAYEVLGMEEKFDFGVTFFSWLSILMFLIPLVGLPASIYARIRARRHGYNVQGARLATIGIVANSFTTLLWLVIVPLAIFASLQDDIEESETKTAEVVEPVRTQPERSRPLSVAARNRREVPAALPPGAAHVPPVSRPDRGNLTQGNRGVVAVKGIDSSSVIIPGAKITYTLEGNEEEQWHTLSDAWGRYDLELPTGRYKVRVEHEHFQTYAPKTGWNIVRPNTAGTANFFLVPKSLPEGEPAEPRRDPPAPRTRVAAGGHLPPGAAYPPASPRPDPPPMTQGLSGVVKVSTMASSRAVIPDARITFSLSANPAKQWHAVSDAWGRYEIELPEGRYRAAVEHEHFRTSESGLFPASVEPNTFETRNFYLSPKSR